MAIYYVSKSGNDSNAGTDVGAPKLTAGSAFAAVSQGDSIIFLDSGTYSGSDNTNITARNVDDITIKADDGTYSGAVQSPVIDGGGTAGYFIKYDENYTFSGLTFTNFATTTLGLMTFRTTSGLTALTIRDCIFHDNTGQIIRAEYPTHTTVERCQFYNNTVADTGSPDVGYQIGTGTKRLTLKNSLFYNIGPRNQAFVMVDSRNADTSITHCTFAKRNSDLNSASIPTSLFRIGGGEFKYNIVYNFPAVNETILATAGAEVEYNAYGSTESGWEGTDGPVDGVTPSNNITLSADPGFVSYSGDDYRLNAGGRSIVLDTASGSAETVDITNSNRASLDQMAYNAGINDMGCYEASFYTTLQSETVPQISGDFTINTHRLSRPNFHRAKDTAGTVQATLEQVPFSAGVNGFIPSVIKQTGLAPNAKQPRVSYSNTKGDSKTVMD